MCVHVFPGSTMSSHATQLPMKAYILLAAILELEHKVDRWICMHGPTPTNRQAHPEDQKLKEQG